MSEILNVSVLSSLYLWLAIAMTFLFVLKLIAFSWFGMDDGSGDLVGTDVDTGFSFISLQSVLAFLMGFGWLGYTAIKFNFSALISVIFAIVGGLILMGISVWLVFLMRKLNSTPKYDLNSLVEKTGTSYTRFDANGTGKIQIEFNGKLETFDAWNDTEEPIESFKNIKVLKIVDNKIFVCEIK